MTSDIDTGTIKDLLQKGQSEYKKREAMRKEPDADPFVDAAYDPSVAAADNVEYLDRTQFKSENEEHAHRTLCDLGGFDAWLALQQTGRVSRKFSLMRYLGWSEEDILENERLWRLENPPRPSVMRRMAPHAAAAALGIMVAAMTLAAIGVAAVAWRMLF